MYEQIVRRLLPGVEYHRWRPLRALGSNLVGALEKP